MTSSLETLNSIKSNSFIIPVTLLIIDNKNIINNLPYLVEDNNSNTIDNKLKEMSNIPFKKRYNIKLHIVEPTIDRVNSF